MQKGDACIDQESTDEASVSGRIEDLIGILDGAARTGDVEQLKRHVQDQNEVHERAVEVHLNRHRDQIVWRIEKLGRKLTEELAGAAGSESGRPRPVGGSGVH